MSFPREHLMAGLVALGIGLAASAGPVAAQLSPAQLKAQKDHAAREAAARVQAERQRAAAEARAQAQLEREAIKARSQREREASLRAQAEREHEAAVRAQVEYEREAAIRAQAERERETAAAKARMAETERLRAEEIDAARAAWSRTKPLINDPAEAAYSFSVFLLDAKLYAAAQQELRKLVESYPRYSKISHARYYLGRAYFDDGKPGEAARWFLRNYQADKTGERRADSLLYIAASMRQLGDSVRACIALSEFSENFPPEANGRLRDLYNATRRGLTC